MNKVDLVEALKEHNLDDADKKVMGDVSKAVNLALEDALKGAITADEAKKAIADAIKALPTTFSAKSIIMPGTAPEGGEDKNLDEMMRDAMKELAEAKKAVQGAGASKNPLEAQRDALKELLDRAKAQKSGMGSNTPFAVSADKDFDSDKAGNHVSKVAVQMTSASVTGNASGATVPTNYLYGGENTAMPDVRTMPNYITPYLDNGTTDLAAMPYYDKLPTEGTMQIIGPGVLKPLLSFSRERRFSTAFKIAGRMKMVEEALDDIPGFQSDVNGELTYAFDIADQNATFAHVAAFAPAFVAGALAATTTAPSNYDAVRAAIYAIRIASKMRFVPNVVVVNSADKYSMGATKDANNNYVFPPFIMPDGTRIEGVQVLETVDPTNVPPGTFIVGDFRQIKRRVYKAFNVRVGQGINTDGQGNVQSDFESNVWTTLGEGRQHRWHYKNAEVGFVKSTFAAVKTAIATT